jgi:hypothetical protein
MQRTIRISLDAILFEDGRAAGPDEDGRIHRWKAEVDAAYDIYDFVCTPLGNVQAQLKSIAETAYDRSSVPQDQRNSTHLILMANSSENYEQCYTLMRGHTAAVILERIVGQGEAATIQLIQGWMRLWKRVHIRYPH